MGSQEERDLFTNQVLRKGPVKKMPPQSTDEIDLTDGKTDELRRTRSIWPLIN